MPGCAGRWLLRGATRGCGRPRRSRRAGCSRESGRSGPAAVGRGASAGREAVRASHGHDRTGAGLSEDGRDHGVCSEKVAGDAGGDESVAVQLDRTLIATGRGARGEGQAHLGADAGGERARTLLARCGAGHIAVAEQVGEGVGPQLRERALLRRGARVAAGAPGAPGAAGAVAERPRDSIEPCERAEGDRSGEGRAECRHAVVLGRDPDGAVLASAGMPIREGDVVQLIAEPGEASAQLGRGHLGGQSRGALIERGERGGGQGRSDSADELTRLPPQACLRQGGASTRQVLDQQPGVLELSGGHALGHVQRHGELGPDRPFDEVARFPGRAATGERLRAAQRCRVGRVQSLGGGEVQRSRGAGEPRRMVAEGADLLESLLPVIRHTRIESGITDIRAPKPSDPDNSRPDTACGGGIAPEQGRPTPSGSETWAKRPSHRL